MSTSYAPLPTDAAPFSSPPLYSPPPEASTRSLQHLELPSPSSSPPPTSRRPRSNTLTGFEFGRNLDIPLSLSEEESARNAASSGGTGEKHVKLINGVALVVGLQVGSGIFSSPGVVLASVGSTGAALIVWLVSGILAWSGASSFAELGSAIPINGGPQVYLAYAYGPLISYLFSWTAISLLKPGSAAIISLIFGEYITKLLYNATTPTSTSSTSSLSTTEIPDWPHKLLAALAVVVISLINILSNRTGTGLQVALTTIKVASLVFVLALGVVGLVRGGGGALSSTGLFEGTSTNAGSYAIALYSGLWSFDGWDQSNYVAGEMVNVNRDLPRVIHGSMALVTTLFTLANVAYFVVLSKDVVASSNTVALDFGSAILGPIGGIIFALVVAVSCFGALNGSFYTTARLIRALALEGIIPSTFGKLSKRETPDYAMALQAVMTIAFIAFGGGFRTLVNLFSVASWLFYLLTVLGLIILRFKEPHLERPYRTYLITPVTFCIVALFLLTMPIIAAPSEAIAAFAFISVGIPLYYLTASSRDKSTSSGPASQMSIKDRLLDAWDAMRGLLANQEGTRESGGRFVRAGTRGSEIVEMVSPREGEDRGRSSRLNR